jgi:tetratricopeptide (TPR) repeat protein
MRSLFSLYIRWWKTWRALPVFAWVRAADAYRAGRFQDAERFYKQGIEKAVQHPARFSARLDLAFCLFKNGKFDQAKEHLHHVITFHQKNREAYVRLGRLQLWQGHSVEATWTFRRALQRVAPDGELVGLFLLSALDSPTSVHFVREAIEMIHSLPGEERTHPLVELALVKRAVLDGRKAEVWKTLIRLVSTEAQSTECLVYHAELLIQEANEVHARRQLQRALSVRPDCPQVLSLLARTYLMSGEGYNPSFSLQLSLAACQNSGWKNPRALHVLADAYLHLGDKMSAFLIASKAKDVNASLLGSYREENQLEALIDSLSSGTLS